MARLTSTGRRPALNLQGVETLLSAYFAPEQPSVEALAASQGVTEATVRKYLKLALGSLPRGRAALCHRDPRNIQVLLNGIATEALLGSGRVELLLRRRSAGASLTQLAQDFGISRDRVSKLLASHQVEAPAVESPAEEVPASADPEA